MGFSVVDKLSKLAGGSLFEARCNEAPFEVVFNDRVVSLRDYGADDPNALPRLIQPPLAANSAMFDMHPDASAIKALKARGLRVYFLDLGAPSFEDRNTSLEDYQCWIRRSMQILRERHEVPKIDLIGYCLGDA